MTDVLEAGMTLKLERVARQVKAKDLAERMGVSRAWLSNLEGRYVVPQAFAVRYREALATFPAVANRPEAA